MQSKKGDILTYEDWLSTFRDKSVERQSHFVRKKKRPAVSNDVKVRIVLLCHKYTHISLICQLCVIVNPVVSP